MRGETKIELINESGQVVETYYDKNMITNGIADLLQNNPFGNVNFSKKLLPMTKLMNGIYLFGSPITADANIVNFPDGVNPPLVWAGSGVNADTSYPDRGSFNAIESEYSEHQIKLVWDFNSKQANHTYSCVCLTSAYAGDCNEIDINKFTDVGITPMDVSSDNTITNAQCFNYKKGLWYHIKPIVSATTIQTERGTEKLYQLTGFAIDVARRGAYKIGFTQDNANSNISFPVGTYSYNIGTPFTYRRDINGVYDGNASIMSVDYDADTDVIHVYGIHNGDSELYDIKLTPGYIADQFNGFTLSQKVSVMNIGNIYIGYAVAIFDGTTIPKDVIPVVDGYMYLAYASDTTNYSNFMNYATGDLRWKLYKVEIVKPANSSTICSEEKMVSIFTRPAPAPMYGIAFKNEHTYYGHEMTIIGGKVHLNNDPKNYETIVGDYAHDIGHNYLVTRTGKILFNGSILCSINNLQDPVTKNQDQSMKITYIVKDN